MELILGNCLEKLKELGDNSVDAIVTDPPYGLSFMSKKWDYDVPSVEIWKECIRVLKPGGYLLSFAGTRTQHRMAVNIEDAGFEIRDMIMYVYGSGFPKSLNIFKQLKKRCTCGNMEAYEQGRNVQWVSNKQEAEHSMRPMSEANLSQTINPKEKQGEVLQQNLSEQGVSVPGKASNNDGREEPSLERGSNLQESKGELQGSDIPEVSKEVFTNGEERRIHNATQVGNGTTLEQAVGERGGSTPPRPQSQQQQDREPCTFCKQYGTQAMGALGLGSALKPACEPITVARKPISEKNLADNHLKWGVGGINIDGCRVGYVSEYDQKHQSDIARGQDNATCGKFFGGKGKSKASTHKPTGRFPANLIHDGSEEVAELFPYSKTTAGVKNLPTSNIYGGNALTHSKTLGSGEVTGYTDQGSASRFFYCAKASKKERNIGCEGLEKGCFHPTVKPLALMEYLVKLVSREGQVVLDPFMGSGTTGMACKKLNREFIGMEMMPEYMEIAKARIEGVKKEEQLGLI